MRDPLPAFTDFLASSLTYFHIRYGPDGARAGIVWVALYSVRATDNLFYSTLQ